MVDADGLSVLLESFRKTGKNIEDGDISEDEVVDFDDLGLLLDHFGEIKELN